MALKTHRHQAAWPSDLWAWLERESARRKASVAQILRDLVVEAKARASRRNAKKAS